MFPVELKNNLVYEGKIIDGKKRRKTTVKNKKTE